MKINSRRLRRSVQAALVTGVVGIGMLATTSCTEEEVARFSIATIFPVEEQEHAVRVARCESNFRPDAVSPGNYGMFQINGVNQHTVEDAGLDWEEVKVSTYANTLAAYELWKRSGWGIWSCR